MNIISGDRIVVTGATSFLGSHVMPALKNAFPQAEIIGLCSRDYDLTKEPQVVRLFEDLKPDCLIHLAAYVGGILANRDFPADFFHRNALMTTLVFHYAAVYKTRKMIFPMGGCSYPHDAKSPISEDQMWNGYPQSESAGYSMAKKMGIVASISYRKQYGLNSVVLVPGNLYGEYDNYHREHSHVIPAMIRRYFEATQNGLPEVQMWGSGKPTRDFVYAGDVGALFPWFVENYDSSEIINISSGTRTSIRELAETIKKHTGYSGEIKWDASKPDGQIDKIFDVSRLKALGLSCNTSLDEGLRRTVAWFAGNYHKEGAIRL